MLRTTESEDLNSKLAQENALLREQLADLKSQLDWFKRQLFGRKSEKQLLVDPALQGNLLANLGVETPPMDVAPVETVSYQRRPKQRDANTVTDTGLRFDATVPVQVIDVPNPEIKGVPTELLEEIGTKVTHRLAQRPGSYVVLQYERKVFKRRDTQAIVTPAAPAHVLDKSVADVSFLAGMLVDKFLYHLPLYRQHQRLQQSGIQLSRATLTYLASRAIALLEPIYDAQFANILLSRVLGLDETPIKAGRKEKGKMRQAWFWPLMGEQDEILFYYTPDRAHRHVQEIIGSQFQGVLVTDGYDAYAKYAEKVAATIHALCWAHTRRGFERAQDMEPQAAQEALTLIGALYHQEKIIRDKALVGEEKLAYRSKHSEPIVKAFWHWCEQQCQRPDLLPKNPLSKALKYAMSRRTELQVFLTDPEVPLDTNHVERALRSIPMGRRNWLFCWTELGAKQVAIIQSLIVTCKLQGIDPYTYLVDVLQRISQHPASKVVELTPRVWKEKFAGNPMKSDPEL